MRAESRCSCTGTETKEAMASSCTGAENHGLDYTPEGALPSPQFSFYPSEFNWGLLVSGTVQFWADSSHQMGGTQCNHRKLTNLHLNLFPLLLGEGCFSTPQESSLAIIVDFSSSLPSLVLFYALGGCTVLPLTIQTLVFSHFLCVTFLSLW